MRLVPHDRNRFQHGEEIIFLPPHFNAQIVQLKAKTILKFEQKIRALLFFGQNNTCMCVAVLVAKKEETRTQQCFDFFLYLN